MTNTKVRLVMIVAACLALVGALAPRSGKSPATTTTTTTTYGTNSTDEGHQDGTVLITDAGYMVAVG